MVWERFEGVEVWCGRGLWGLSCVVGGVSGGGGVLWEGFEGRGVVGGV